MSLPNEHVAAVSRAQTSSSHTDSDGRPEFPAQNTIQTSWLLARHRSIRYRA